MSSFNSCSFFHFGCGAIPPRHGWAGPPVASFFLLHPVYLSIAPPPHFRYPYFSAIRKFKKVQGSYLLSGKRSVSFPLTQEKGGDKKTRYEMGNQKQLQFQRLSWRRQINEYIPTFSRAWGKQRCVQTSSRKFRVCCAFDYSTLHRSCRRRRSRFFELIYGKILLLFESGAENANAARLLQEKLEENSIMWNKNSLAINESVSNTRRSIKNRHRCS